MASLEGRGRGMGPMIASVAAACVAMVGLVAYHESRAPNEARPRTSVAVVARNDSPAKRASTAATTVPAARTRPQTVAATTPTTPPTTAAVAATIPALAGALPETN